MADRRRRRHRPPYTLREVLLDVAAWQWRQHRTDAAPPIEGPDNADEHEWRAFWQVVEELRSSDHPPCEGCRAPR
ncbi:MAG: hypothetical protein ACRD07_19315 [Acidimicrobiales bacterium]